MTFHDQLKDDLQMVDDISHLPDKQQAEIIAEKFASIQNEYHAFGGGEHRRRNDPSKDTLSLLRFSYLHMLSFEPIW